MKSSEMAITATSSAPRLWVLLGVEGSTQALDEKHGPGAHTSEPWSLAQIKVLLKIKKHLPILNIAVIENNHCFQKSYFFFTTTIKRTLCQGQKHTAR